MAISTLSSSVEETSTFFGVFDNKPKNLIPTGLTGLDKEIGGIFPGFPLVLGAMTGVGKSNLVQVAALSCSAKVGIISLEDTADIWGSRLLARYSGINSRRLRQGGFSKSELQRLTDARESVSNIHHVLIRYAIGGRLSEVLLATQELIDAGSQIIWLDYLHKIKGTGSRKDDISVAFSDFQNLCYKGGVAPIIVTQFARKTVWTGEHTREASVFDPPQISWLKDSGDIENEARIILLGYRDRNDKDILRLRMAKSTIGGVGKEFLYKYQSCGTLNELTSHNDTGPM